jgi:hypothetical protein
MIEENVRHLPKKLNTNLQSFNSQFGCQFLSMAQQRMALWAAEADIDEDVDLSLAIGNYGQNGHYDDGESHFT